MRGRRLIVGILVAFVALGSASASAASPQTYVQKPGESIVVYSGRSESLVKPIFEQFTKKTGIQVEVRYGDSGALAAQLLTEANASPADVFFSQDAGALGALSNARLLAKLPVKTLEQVPQEYRAVNATWVGVSGRVRVLVYNPNLVANPPKTIDALLVPEWNGKLGYAPTNASWQSFVTALRVQRGEVRAEKWLRGFAATGPKAYASNSALRDAVNAGQISIGLTNHYYIWQKISVVGAANFVARNQYLAPGDPGGLLNVAGVAILKSSDNKLAAGVFVDFMLGKVAQNYFAQNTFEYPLVAGVPTSVKIPKLVSLRPPKFDLSDLDTLAATQELLVKVKLLTR